MTTEHVDVLVVGAGLSGVGAASQLRMSRPHDTVAILEAREAMGGTWDLFRYPGVRSDSDMYTLGYSFEPWTEAEAIADGPSILRYIRRTAERHGIAGMVRYRHRVMRADWSSQQCRWTVLVERTDADGGVSRRKMTCRWLHLCTGYYRYDEGYTPDIAGLDDFAGVLVHPQQWPDDLDYAGKKVVVVGSGATAVTLVPAMAETAAHVTMVQRSPTYVVPRPSRDPVADGLRRVLPARAAHGVVRWKNALSALAVYELSQRRPDTMRQFFRKQQQPYVGDELIDEHFTPSYGPWDQRVCLAPDGDFFVAVDDGRASVVTGTIDAVTPTGVRLESGQQVVADVLVLATGLRLVAFGGIRIGVDGVEGEPGDAVVYKGMLVAGVPNLSFASGYTNASWTLKADLVSEYLCRMLDYLDSQTFAAVVPQEPPADQPRRPLIGLDSGYVRRSESDLPKQGSRAPWALYQNYPKDVWMLRHSPIGDEGVRFVRSPGSADQFETVKTPATRITTRITVRALTTRPMMARIFAALARPSPVSRPWEARIVSSDWLASTQPTMCRTTGHKKNPAMEDTSAQMAFWSVSGTG